MNKHTKSLFFFLLTIICTVQAQDSATGLRMPAIYSDNMVLQRNIPLTVSGLADARAKVTVKIAKREYTCRAASNGNWSVVVAPLNEKEVYTLSIETAAQQCVFRNVLAGEVWICSGQSNMAFPLAATTNAREDIPLSNHPEIRLFDMKPRWETDAVAWPFSSLDSVNRLQYFKPSQWMVCTEQSVSQFSAVAYYFGKLLADSLHVPVGLICNAIGGSPCESWIDRRTLEDEFPEILRDWTHNERIQDWVRQRALLNIKKSDNKQQRHPYEPCYLFESAIAPLSRFAVRGAIWYQGESNAHDVDVHEKLFPLLAQSWRKTFQNTDMPIYNVQLSSLNRPDWPAFRDSQRRLMEKVPHTGMAVSTDKGDSLDVHPRQKKEIGERLAYWALNQTYHHKVIPSGPLVKSAKAENHSILLTFKYAEGMKTSDGKLMRTFEITGTDGLYQPAQAEISGNKFGYGQLR